MCNSYIGHSLVSKGRRLHFNQPVVTQTHRIAHNVIKPQPAKQSSIKPSPSTPAEFNDLYFRHTAMYLYISGPTLHATFIHDTSVTNINMTTGWKAFHSASVLLFPDALRFQLQQKTSQKHLLIINIMTEEHVVRSRNYRPIQRITIWISKCL